MSGFESPPSRHCPAAGIGQTSLRRTPSFPARSAEIPFHRTAASEGEGYSPVDGCEEYLAVAGNHKAVVGQDRIEAAATCRRDKRESIGNSIRLRTEPAVR